MWPLWVTSTIYVCVVLVVGMVPPLYMEDDARQLYVGVGVPLLAITVAIMNYVLVSRPLAEISDKIDEALEQRNLSEGHQRAVLRAAAAAREKENQPIGGGSVQLSGSSAMSLKYSLRHQQQQVDDVGVNSYHSELYKLQCHTKDLLQTLVREQQSLYKLQSETLSNTRESDTASMATGRGPLSTSRSLQPQTSSRSLGRMHGQASPIPERPATRHLARPANNEPMTFADEPQDNNNDNNNGGDGADRLPQPRSTPPPPGGRGKQTPPPHHTVHVGPVPLAQRRGRNSALDEFVSCNSDDDDDEPLEAMRYEDREDDNIDMNSITVKVQPQLVEPDGSEFRSPSQVVPSPMKPPVGREPKLPPGTLPVLLTRGNRFSEDTPNICLYMKRSKNANLVIYEGKVEKPMDPHGTMALSLAEPLDGYWLDLDEKAVAKARKKGKTSDRVELEYFEKKFAYGFDTSVIPKETGMWKVVFVALEKRPMTLSLQTVLHAANEGEPGVPTVLPCLQLAINGVQCIVEYIYVKSKEPKHVWNLPTVEYIDVVGYDMKTGNECQEKILPK